MSSSAEVAGTADVASDRWLRFLAWGLLGVTVAGAVGSLALDFMAGRGTSNFASLPFLSYVFVGVLLATRRPHNPLGWLMMFAALGFAAPGESYAYYATITRHGELPGAGLALAISGPMWVPFIGLSGFMLLLFPDGHLPSPGWRWFARLCAVGLTAIVLSFLFLPSNYGDDYGLPQLHNPLGIAALKPFIGPLLALVVFAPLTVVGGAAGVIVRLRRTTDPVVRHQLRWLAWGAGVIAVTYVLAFLPQLLFGSPNGSSQTWSDWLGNVAVTSFMLIPITIGIAVLRYRLYDVDIVIRKTVLYAILAFLLLGLGFGLTWALSSIFATTIGGGRLDLVAGVVIGALFWPLRRVATRIADRVVYGGRATPYEVLSEFGGRLAETYSADDVLPRTAKILGEAIGARSVTVSLSLRDELRPVAEWSRGEPGGSAAEEHRTEVRHQGELLGALTVTMPPNDPMDPSKERLVTDFASQAGLLLRNVRLVEEVRASRRRLVAAQDQERRKLERNIHDGAQQQLVALAVKARLARQLTERDPAKAAEMLEQIERETQAALDDLRDLARGIYPPLLADRGLAAALEAQARRSIVPVEVSPDGVGRYPQQIEAAIYFSCLEAMQNVGKYASASHVAVRLRASEGELVFEVADDGDGFDPSVTRYGTGLQGIADRLAALDGRIEVQSAPGAGTTVRGMIPLSANGPVVIGGGS